MEYDAGTLVVLGIIGLTTLGMCWAIYVIFGYQPPKPIAINTNKPRDNSGPKMKPPQEKEKIASKKKKQRNTSSTSEIDEQPHPWQAALFKGHQETINDMDWSSNGKFLASCAQDRTVLLWFAKDLLDKNRRSIRVNIPFDSALKLAWSPDSKAFLVAKDQEKIVEVYKLKKKEEGAHITVYKFTSFKSVHEDDIVGLGVACNGRFIMSCSKDGNMVISDVKGNVLDRVQVAGTPISYARVSRCGRFVAACCSNCLVYEVVFNNSDAFQCVKSFGTLKGNESRVTHIDFNADSSKMATITEKGVWRLYDTTGNRVTMICVGNMKRDINLNIPNPTVALSNDGRLIAASNGSNIEISTVRMGSLEPITPVWIIPTDMVTSIMFSVDGKYILTAGEKNIRVFHNICGYQTAVTELTKLLVDVAPNSASKTRLTNELIAAKAALKALVSADQLILSNQTKSQ